ncbi:ABC-2 family transporter protein [Paenibacillus tyrfis]|uniref:ABC-2 family transporter protein n=1 Tax=Paenibacillus tyrfis TaxID=1501230 RepID=UPI0020A11D3F|nr:ABC-2 family transporter protein [Paenibacillus tyrfis]MCP1311563.1 ABC-2 family transporter protein [Paenibacillus tyrfis]
MTKSAYHLNYINKSLKLLWKQQFIHPLNFWVTSIAVFLVFLTGYASIYFLMLKFGNVASWNIHQITFLYGLYVLCYGLTNVVMSQFKYFDSYVHRGKLDILLCRPRNVLLQIALQGFEFVSFGHISLGILLLFVSSIQLKMQWDLWVLGKLLLVVLNAVLMMAAIYIIGAVASIFIIQGRQVRDLAFMTLQNYLVYPLEAYHPWTRIIITAIPLSFILYFPVRWLMDDSANAGIFTLGTGILFLTGAIWLWNRMLCRYDGSSS